MIDIEKYRRKFEVCCVAAGLKKLSEPVETKEYLYCVLLDDHDIVIDFDICYWKPAVMAMLHAIVEQDNGEYYRLDVHYNEIENNMLVITSSRGEANGD